MDTCDSRIGSAATAFENAETIDAYLAKPIGSCLLGPTYAVFWWNRRLNGILFWDRPLEEHVERIIRALDADLQPGVEPHGSFVDARRVRAVDLGAFNLLSRYVRERREPFARVVQRQALVRPSGLAGAAIAGFYAVLSPSYPVNVFTEPEDALRWLDIADEGRVAAEIDRLYGLATTAPAIVVALRAHLDQRLGAKTLHEAAETLGLSPRQLQRKLRDAQTCFQTEEADAKVRTAKTLLLETSYSIKRVAIEVGCSSLQHFAAMFRKATGETPTQWRVRHRPAGLPVDPVDDLNEPENRVSRS